MKTLIFLILFGLSTQVLADSDSKKTKKMDHKAMDHKAMDHKAMNHKDHDHKDQKAFARKINKEELLISVQGMVCAFCAQGIEKNFKRREEVKEVDVNLDKMLVKVKLNKGKSLSEKVIKEIVTGAGFKFVGFKK